MTLDVSMPLAISQDDVKGEPTPPINVYKLKIMDARILIERYEGSEKSANGLFLPKGAADDKAVCVAKVLRVGTGRVNEDGKVFPPRVQVGDNIIIGKHAGTQITAEKYRIINEIEVMAILEQ
jgi:chaperonin GroES